MLQEQYHLTCSGQIDSQIIADCLVAFKTHNINIRNITYMSPDRTLDKVGPQKKPSLNIQFEVVHPEESDLVGQLRQTVAQIKGVHKILMEKILT